MTSGTTDKWVVEWSDAQECYHIDTLSKSIAGNMRSFINKWPLQYTIIAICDSPEEADQWFEKLDKARNEQNVNP